MIEGTRLLQHQNTIKACACIKMRYYTQIMKTFAPTPTHPFIRPRVLDKHYPHTHTSTRMHKHTYKYTRAHTVTAQVRGCSEQLLKGRSANFAHSSPVPLTTCLP